MWFLFVAFAAVLLVVLLLVRPPVTTPPPPQQQPQRQIEIPVTSTVPPGGDELLDGTPYATTPINKLDDYDYARVFGFQAGDRMIVPPLVKEGFLSGKELAASYTPHHGRSKDKEVDEIVAKLYADDPDWEPVVTRVGANRWEVTELKQKRRLSRMEYPEEAPRSSSPGGGGDPLPYVKYTMAPVDPYFSGLPSQTADPYQGTVPGMERMFAPTFDRKSWV